MCFIYFFPQKRVMASGVWIILCWTQWATYKNQQTTLMCDTLVLIKYQKCANTHFHKKFLVSNFLKLFGKIIWNVLHRIIINIVLLFEN